MSESLLKAGFWEEGRLGLCERHTFFSQRLQLGKGLSSPGAAAVTLDGTPSQGVGLGFYCKRLLSWYCQDLIQRAVPPAAGQHCLREQCFLQVSGTSDITSTDGSLHQEDGTCCGRNSEDTDHRANEWACQAKAGQESVEGTTPCAVSSSSSLLKPHQHSGQSQATSISLKTSCMVTQMSCMSCIQGHLCHVLSLKSSYSEQCLRKKIIPRPLSAFLLLMVPILATSEEQCLAWPSVEPGPL